MANRGRIAQVETIPAPVGGLNGRDALANMPATDAIVLTNMFPTPSSVQLRNGYVNFATGLGAPVQTLMPYASPSGTSKLWAATSTAIFDASSAGAVGAATLTGKTSGRWQYTNIGTPGGWFLYAFNGSDDAILYNGTSWQSVNSGSAPISVTGVNTSAIINCTVYKNRLWMVEKDSFSVWYLALNSVGGAATELDLSSQFKLGGFLVAAASWSVDNAGGLNEYLVFLSSNGEALVYSIPDPSTPSGWSVVGKFRVGRPIGYRCFEKFGSDLVLICIDGVIPLSSAMLTDRSQTQNAVTDKIRNIIANDVQLYSGNQGWQVHYHPNTNKLILNVPEAANLAHYQYVMNTQTGAWCKFTGWNALCWATYGDLLVFGGLGIVGKADYGNSDQGTAITSDAKQAFNYFNSPGNTKKFNMWRPLLQANGAPGATLGFDVNFKDGSQLSTPAFAPTTTAIWDVSPWDTTPWGDLQNVFTDWQAITGVGFCGAFRLKLSASGITISWQASQIMFEVGGLI